MIAFVFDTETTGLIENRTVKEDKQPEIIEFYGCLVNLATGEVLAEIDTLIKPNGKISDEITKITGITEDMVKDAKPFKEYALAIVDLIKNSPCVIAHNLSFDMEMLEIEMKRCDIALEWPRRKICTVEATVHRKGYRLNLNALHELLCGEPFQGAHRAKVDVMALIECCKALHAEDEI